MRITRCKVCDYVLNNLKSRQCPECGNTFDPADPNTFKSQPRLIILALFSALGLFLTWTPLILAEGQDRDFVVLPPGLVFLTLMPIWMPGGAAISWFAAAQAARTVRDLQPGGERARYRFIVIVSALNVICFLILILVGIAKRWLT